MLKIKFKLLMTLLIFTQMLYANPAAKHPITRSIHTSQLIGYEDYSKKTQELIKNALALANQQLTYQYGSANPKNGGMDCSGTVYYLLKNMGVATVPRQANEMYLWAEKKGQLHGAGARNIHSEKLAKLQPGDLLFWSGTYVTNHIPPISHVMIYLGKNKEHQMLMFGSSDGRTYQGFSMRGVSVFDFKLPKENAASKFEGYSCIPGLTC